MRVNADCEETAQATEGRDTAIAMFEVSFHEIGEIVFLFLSTPPRAARLDTAGNLYLVDYRASTSTM